MAERKQVYIKEKSHKRNNEIIKCLNKVVLLFKKESEIDICENDLIKLFEVQANNLETNEEIFPIKSISDIKNKFGHYKIIFETDKGTKIETSLDIKKKKKEKFYTKENISKRNKEKISCMNKTSLVAECFNDLNISEPEIIKLCEAKCKNTETGEDVPVKMKGIVYPVVGSYKISFITDNKTKIDCIFEIKKAKSKYNNKKIEVDGIIFDSKKEAKRYEYLMDLQKSGEITSLELQKPYVLIPKQEEERPVMYIADFYYKDKKGREVVEDTKGWRTSDYKIKRKMMRYFYGIKITEI